MVVLLIGVSANPCVFHFRRYIPILYVYVVKYLFSGCVLIHVSSYDLFVVMAGIECAMFPILYPTTDFTDTGIREHYQHGADDDTNRVISIGLSFTRKAQSSVRAYAENRDLVFFLYERYLPSKFFTAQCRAQRMGVTGDCTQQYTSMYIFL